MPWKGEAQEVVTLKLLETFSVGGEVTLPDWSHLNYEGERRIVLSAKVGTTKRILASIREVEAGSWGPIDVPRIQGATYEARLEGSPIIPISLELAPPPAGGHARIDFHAEIGHDVWIAGVDESGELLPNTEGTVWWVEDGVTRSLTRRCYPESDLINLWSVPAGPVHYMVRAPGYVPSFGGPLVVPQPPEGSYAVTLRRGGALAGRCIYEGEPLSDFDVFVWRGHAEVRAHRFPFRDRRDGRFEIEAAPLGDVWVSATSGRLPACAPRQVHIEGDETAEVVLDLEEGHDGRGEVVDAADGTPVETARIQRFLMAGQQAHDRWGDRVPVQGDGSFVVTDLSSGYNLIEVSAPGYANLLVGGRVGPDGVADFGTLLLSRSQSFEVRLLSANLEEDFTLYEAFGAEPTTLEAKRFDRDGVVRYENVGPGDHHLRIHREGAMASTTTFHLQPGEPWSFIRMLSGARRLSIEVVPSDEVPLSEVGAYYVRYVNSAGLEVTLDRYFPEDGHIRLDEIDADEVNVIVADKAYRTIASKRASYGDTDELSMRIYLGEEPLRVRLVDAAGTPLSGVLVAATSNLTSRFEAASRTGAGGVAELTGVPTHPFLIAAHHNEYGTLRTEYGGGVGEVTYVLRNDGSVRIRVLDGRTPIAGAQGTIRDALGGRITGIRTTDATGSVHWLNLTPGTYPVRFEHPDAWPVTVELTAAVEGPHAEVQMRRLGDLVVEVSNADGLPVPGATLDLEHAELQESVALWLEAGRVEGSPPMTDPTGHWRVARIPRGIYRWRATGPSGATGEGTLEVLPGVETPVEVRLTVP